MTNLYQSHKMLTGLLARRWCKSPKPFVYNKLQKGKPGLNKDQRLLTLHDFTPPIILYVQLRVYKLPLEIKLRALLKAWSPHVVLSCLLFLLFSSVLPSGQNNWSVGVLCDYLFAWTFKTHSRRHPRWDTFRYSRGRLRLP